MPQSDSPTENSVRFGPFELDLFTGELRKHGVRLKISGQAIRILTMLSATPGEMVTRDALKQALWPGTNFGDLDHGLNAAVTRLREVLGDSASTPAYIETVPGRGYRFIANLEGESTAKEEGVLAPSPSSPRYGRLRRVVIASAAAMVFLVIGGFLVRGSIRRLWRLHELQNLRTVRLTSLPGRVYSPSFSPDGSQVAFAWDGESAGAGYDLYVKVVDSSDPPHRLTQHPGLRLSTAWSADGSNIAISRIAEGANGIFLISPSGGAERRVADRSNQSWYGSEVSWSPDGKELAFIDRPDGKPTSDQSLILYLLPLDTMMKVEVDPGCRSEGTPAFSHNGEYLAWICHRRMFESEIDLLRLRDHKIRSLHTTDTLINGIAWSPNDKRIAFSTDTDSGALREIEIDEPSQVENLSLGQDAVDIATRSSSGDLAYVKESYNVNIWRLDLASKPAKARQLTLSSQIDRAPSISPDGEKIAFESLRSGALQIWTADADGSHAVQVTQFENSITGTPKWSHDGKKIVFDSRRRGGEAEIYIVDRDGGPAHKIPIDVVGDAEPSWSHDGRWIYFSNGDDRGESSIWKVPAEGGHAIRLSAVAGSFPVESADGKLVYFGRGGRIWSVRPDGTEERRIDEIPYSIFLDDEYFPTANGIYFMEHHDRRTEIKFFDFKTRAIRSVYTADRPTTPWIGGMPVSSDGKWMLYPQEDHTSSELMMLENWR